MKEIPHRRFFDRRNILPRTNRSGVTIFAGVLLLATGSCKTRSFQGRLQSEEGKAPEYIHWVPGAEGQNGDWQTEKAERERLLKKLIDPTIRERIKEDLTDGPTYYKALWGFQWQRDTPVGYSGLPLVVFRAIVEDAKNPNSPFRNIWGDLTWYGLTNHPDDFDSSGKLKPNLHRPLPLGMGWTRSPIEPEGNQSKIPVFGSLLDRFNSQVQSHAVQRAFISCGSCHTGRVAKKNPDNSYSIGFMYGAPSTEYDQTAFGEALARTLKIVEDAMTKDKQNNNTVELDKLVAALNGAIDVLVKRENFFPYGHSDGEGIGQAIWKSPLYLILRDKATDGVKREMKAILQQMPAKLGTRNLIVSALDESAYKKTGASAQFADSAKKAPPFNGESPGQLDAFGFGGAIVKVTKTARAEAKPPDDSAVFKSDRNQWSKLVNLGEKQPNRSEVNNRVESYFSKLASHDETREGAEPIVPRHAAKVDPSAIWGERNDLRGQANWDGNQRSAGARALSTSLAIVANPAYVDVKGSEFVASFMAYNPVAGEEYDGQGPRAPRYPSASAIYPFVVNESLLSAGQRIFETKCYTCHHPQNRRIYPVNPTGLKDVLASATNTEPEDVGWVGTDPSRAIQITTPVRDGLLALWNLTCQGRSWCASKEKDDVDVFRKRGEIGEKTGLTGYVASPLDGIWARAPYLHNGSVPNIRALLVPSLRKMTVKCGVQSVSGFWRGNIQYDEANLGFESKEPPFDTCDPNWQGKEKSATEKMMSPFDSAIAKYPTASKSARIFDYTLEGNSNEGHIGAYLGAASKDEPTKWETWKVRELLTEDSYPAEIADELAANALIEYMKTL